MKREYYNQHSDILNEDMSMIVYGEGGYPVIAFQAQDAKSNNFEDFGMIDVLAPFIDEGRIQVFSVDNLDEQSWSDQGGDNGARAWRQEQYFQFVTDELVPRVRAWNNSDRRPLAVGCSMGATHAAIAALRRPDLFQGCIALSGVYRTSFFFGDWMDENLYNNDIPAFLTNMTTDHPYVDLYNQRQLVMCVGQGAWEEGVDDLRYIDDQLNRLGVNHWCDFWGTDVNHDWPWWRKQMPYFMNEVLNDIDAQNATAEVKDEAQVIEEEPKPAAKKPAAKRTTTRKAATTKAAATKTTTAKATTTKAAATKKTAAAKTTTTKAATTKKTTAAKTTATKAATAKTTAAKTTAAKSTTTKATATKTAAKSTTTKATTAKTAAAKTTTRKTTARKTAAKKDDATE
ncbi:MAG: esterase family protein [Atopobiaceae bacterium]|nr:esterase family protein [Atopobiaceae bacterium]